jgi:trehalose 2-sulfotransferase
LHAAVPRYPDLVTSYLVCATPRSGSTLLCEALAVTGVAGRPYEFFEALPATGVPRRPLDYLEGLDDPDARSLVADAPPHRPPPYSDLRGMRRYADHLERARRLGTTPNGVFGAKIMWAHLEPLAAQTADEYGGLELRELLRAVFDDPCYVWVRRGDTVRQAVSLWRAMQTQTWRAENDASQDGGEPRYSFPALRHLVELLTAQDAAWERFFADSGSDVLALSYEEVAADVGGALARTLEHIGVAAPPDAPAAAAPIRRQADERSDAWVAAYARDALLPAR